MKISQTQITGLSPAVRDRFLPWRDFMYDRVRFNMGDSVIHGVSHCERVLLYAMLLGEKIFADDPDAVTALAHASVFHDTRREDEYLDTGHGARAAVYYRQFCDENPEMTFYPEAEYMMRYHDIDDNKGQQAITDRFGESAERVLKLYDVFKDADALDRWRLGSRGLDARFIRTSEAKDLVEYARETVKATMPEYLLSEIESAVNEALDRNEKERTADS